MKTLLLIQAKVWSLGWTKDYFNNVPGLMHEYGGQYILKATKLELVEGEDEPWQQLLIAEFPTPESAKTFYSSAAYEPWKALRQKHGEYRIQLVSG